MLSACVRSLSLCAIIAVSVCWVSVHFPRPYEELSGPSQALCLKSFGVNSSSYMPSPRVVLLVVVALGMGLGVWVLFGQFLVGRRVAWLLFHLCGSE